MGNIPYSSKKLSELEISYSKKEKVAVVIGTLILIGIILVIIINWGEIPDKIAIHFDANGQANSMGSKSAIVIFPIFAVMLYALLVGFSFFPNAYNYPVKITRNNVEYEYHQGRELLLYLNIEILLSFFYIEWNVIKAALGTSAGLHQSFVVFFVLIIFGTIGIKIYKMRKNA